MSVTVKNEPYRHGTPSRTSWARATPLSASATCWASPPLTLTGARRAGQQERGHDDRLLRLGPDHQRVGHAEVPDQRRVRVHDAHQRGLRPRSPRGRRARSRPCGCRRAPAGRSCRTSCTACPTTGSPSTPCPCGAFPSGGRSPRPRPICTQLSTSVACVSLHERVVVLHACRCDAPRRDRSRTAARRRSSTTGTPSRPADRERALGVARAQAGTTTAPSRPAPSRTPRSQWTRSSSTFSPASARSLRACSCITSVPISSRIRIACSWIDLLLLGGEDLQGARHARTSSGSSVGPSIRGVEQLVEGLDAQVVDLEGLAHLLGDLARLRLAVGVGMLADEQDARDVAEVGRPSCTGTGRCPGP